MKLNGRYYKMCATEAYETFTYENNVKVEFHYLNDQSFYNECIQKQRFSTWSTLDGLTYRVFFEKGYYDVMKELYDEKAVKVWVDFWNHLDSMKKKFMFAVLLPVLLVFYGAVFVIGLLFDKSNPGSGTTVILIGGIIGLVLIYILTNNVLTKKMKKENYDAVQRIKKSTGSKTYDRILKAQAKYKEKFYAALYHYEAPKDESEVKESAEAIDAEATVIEETPVVNEEAPEAKEVTETKENVEEK